MAAISVRVRLSQARPALLWRRACVAQSHGAPGRRIACLSAPSSSPASSSSSLSFCLAVRLSAGPDCGAWRAYGIGFGMFPPPAVRSARRDAEIRMMWRAAFARGGAVGRLGELVQPVRPFGLLFRSHTYAGQDRTIPCILPAFFPDRFALRGSAASRFSCCGGRRSGMGGNRDTFGHVFLSHPLIARSFPTQVNALHGGFVPAFRPCGGAPAAACRSGVKITRSFACAAVFRVMRPGAALDVPRGLPHFLGNCFSSCVQGETSCVRRPLPPFLQPVPLWLPVAIPQASRRFLALAPVPVPQRCSTATRSRARPWGLRATSSTARKTPAAAKAFGGIKASARPRLRGGNSQPSFRSATGRSGAAVFLCSAASGGGSAFSSVARLTGQTKGPRGRAHV